MTDTPVTDAPMSDPGPLRAPRIWTLSVDGGSVDVEVTACDEDRLGDVLPALRAALGRPVDGVWVASARLALELPLSAPGLVHGAVLGLGGPVGGDRRSGSSALELHVVGGPDAGRAVPLGQGHHVLGRSDEASVRLDDPDVSRRHVVIQVGGGRITVADLGSTNGSRLDEEELDGQPRPWPTGAVLRLGASAVSVTGPGGATAALETGTAGRVSLRPTPRMAAPSPKVEITFPRPPEVPPRRRLAWFAIALPAVGGVLMAWLLGTPAFLFFALLSPVVALGTWLSERWSGRRSGRRDAAAHALEVLAAEAGLTEAVRADVRAAETTQPDLASLTTAARRRTHLLWSRPRDDADALTVRVGSGPGTTRVTRIQADGSRVRATAPHLPVVVDLRSSGGLAVVGPRERAVGAVGAVVAQLTALHPPGEVDLLLLADAARLHDWEWARWLPHLDPGSVHVRTAGVPGRRRDEALNAWLTAVTARRRSALGNRSGGPTAATPPGWLVVLVDRPLDPSTTATLKAARDAGVVTVAAADSLEDAPIAVDAVLRLTGETGDLAVLSRQGLPDSPDVRVDRLPRTTAAEFARDLAGLAPVASGMSLPSRVRLLDLPTGGLTLDPAGRTGGSWSPARDRLVATLGRTAQGPLQVDLCREGPHALIAGTTGSGKSELLQTLIAALALQHPPDRCSFLLVDYKGGAAFAEAATLPHTVGLVTDLDGQSTARALRSLGAELTRREEILAAHDVTDIAALPDDVALARLVIVVDEFAALAEELPSFVPGLIGIAQRGRSLGVHLVLATQRPSGVVSPEIRANCTLRICLRTTDEADSRDVLGTTDAAHLPVELPGRAYIRSGSGAPTALQIARVAAPAHRSETAPEAHLRVWPWPAQVAPGHTVDGETDLARLCRAVIGHAEEIGRPAPHRPWRPPLPERFPVTALDELVTGGAPDADPTRGRLPIGLVDRPDIQARERLELDLEEGGTWLAVGGPRSGRTTLLRTVLGEAVHRFSPDELHVHVIESGGGSLAADAAVLPHAGTTVGGDDALRAVRLLDRLGREVAARRAGGSPAEHPLLLLLVDGVELLSTLLDDADPVRGSAAFLRLLRDGAAVGLTCVLTADRAVPGGRLAATARQRLVLPLPDGADYAVAGVPSRAVPASRTAGRALVGEEALECQLALPRQLEPVAPSRRPFPPPVRIVDLPPDPWLVLPPRRAAPVPARHAPDGHAPEGRVLALPVGPGGDEGDPLVIDLLRTGGLLVSGPPGCGRSTALEAFAQHLLATGAAVLRICAPTGQRGASAAEPDVSWLDAGDEAGVRGWVAELAGRPGVVIADDVGSPAECAALAALPALGGPTGVALIAAAGPGQLSSHYQGTIAALRRGRAGLLLCPGPGDADLLGVRLPRTPLPVRPGSGWLVTGAAVERVQVARRRRSELSPPPPAAGQSNSSAGPISCLAYQASS